MKNMELEFKKAQREQYVNPELGAPLTLTTTLTPTP